MPASEAKYGGISSDAVRAKTGKGWDEWLRVLDKEKATTLSHKDIARMLYEKYNVPDWWCQMVTVGYEQARGMRAVHQKSDGFSASASKTVNAPVSKLFQASTDEAMRAKWMGKKKYEITKATPNKSVRIGWGKNNASKVDFYLTAKGKDKSQVAIQHSKLADAKAVESSKAYWRGALEKLAKLVEE
jgi:uncharacterized protein YndB with AHSA1/START domain